MKTKNLGRKALEHLEIIGYKLIKPIEELTDSPFLFLIDDEVHTCTSVKEYQSSSLQEKKQEQILKLRPKLEKLKVKELSAKEKILYKLLAKLNTKKVSSITGYDVSWTIQEVKREHNRFEILPISPHACGSISMEHLEVILEFAKKYPHIHPTLSYTDWNDEKKRYGTYKPCIYFY